MPFCAYCGSQVAQVSLAPCPTCGKPSNGAPRPVVKGGTSVVLIVILVVFGLIVVAGIVAAIAIPNLLTATQRAKQKRTMADVRTIATALEAYGSEHQRYPPPDALEKELVPKYVSSLPTNDGWNHPLRYECWSTRGETTCDAYAIGSSAKDGVFERASLREYEGAGPTNNFNGDIVFISGQFAQYPQGAQR